MSHLNRRRFLQGVAMTSLLGLYTQGQAVTQIPIPEIRRRLRFTLSFSNPLNRPLVNQRFWCYLPASATPAQHLRDVQVSTSYRMVEDELRHHILELSFDYFPPLAQKVVMVTTEVEIDAAVKQQVLLNPSSWLIAERFIESDDLRIRTLADELRRPTAMDTVRAIFEWVRGGLSYSGYVAEDLGALHALMNRQGDCTEYADLVVALVRANGIPARMVGGYVTDHDFAPLPQDYHNWAEVYLDGAWRVIDAQKGNWLAPVGLYIAFRIYQNSLINPVGQAHRYLLQGDLQVTF